MTAITSSPTRRRVPSPSKLGGMNSSTRRKSNTVDSIVQQSVQQALDIHLTLRWWLCLSTIAIFNIGIWSYSCYRILFSSIREDGSTEKIWTSSNINDDHPYQLYHLFLSGIYVFVCAYRSFLPRIDLERYCLFDTRLSSIFLGRLAATVAEISFSAQIALFLHHIGEVHDHYWTQRLALCLVPVITIAQCFCWCGVVTLNHLYHAIEESIWAVSALFIGAAMGSLAYHQSESCGHVGIMGMVMCTVFFIFMVTVDVPMYIKRWRAGQRYTRKFRRSNKDVKKKKQLIYMNSFEGSVDAMSRRVVTKSWSVWKEETMWLTMYFSTAVWLSILLVHKSIQNI